LSKLFCKFLAPWKARVLFVCPELALTHFEMKTSTSVAVRESGGWYRSAEAAKWVCQGIFFFRGGIPSSSPIESAKALLPEAEILSIHNHWEEDWSKHVGEIWVFIGLARNSFKGLIFIFA
jgi:hypothetical protein